MPTLSEKQLGQVRPVTTEPSSVYSPGASVSSTIIKTIIICNQSASSANYRIFYNSSGSVYDVSTAIFYDVPLDAKTTAIVETYMAMNDANGNVAVRTDTPSALTFTLAGAEVT